MGVDRRHKFLFFTVFKNVDNKHSEYQLGLINKQFTLVIIANQYGNMLNSMQSSENQIHTLCIVFFISLFFIQN